MEKRHRYFFLGYLLQLVLFFYFKIGEPRSPDCNDKKNNLLGTKRKCPCNVCVNNIVLFITVSRHAIHHDNILTRYSFQPLHLNFVLYIALGKIRRENGQKWSSERFSVLCAKFRDRSLLMSEEGSRGGESWGGSDLFYFREKGWAKRDFHDGWGWVIVCFVKNHTHYNSCGRSK